MVRFAGEFLWKSRRRIAQSSVCLAFDNYFHSTVSIPCSGSRKIAIFSVPFILKGIRSGSSVFFCSFSPPIGHSNTPGKVNPFDDNGDGDNSEDDEHFVRGGLDAMDEDSELKVSLRTIVEILRMPGANGVMVGNKLEKCGIVPKPELVAEVLAQVRNNWEAAFTFFLWAGRQPGYAHSLREYHSMISILGKMRRFDTAWSLIHEMKGGKTAPFLVVPKTLLIMIRKYCAAHEVGRAINTFYSYKSFKFETGMNEFHDLLSALCRYKNVKEAEDLLSCNENVFPLNTKSFNIILNGWCNIVCNSREAKRIWKEMKKRRIPHDAYSYSSILSCYSKLNRLNVVLKLFEHMKALDISPDRKVYNAVIYALGKGRLTNEAKNVMKAMEDNGIVPTTVTYNSLITPLSRANQAVEAREIFDEMLKRRVFPNVQTYHALFRITRTGDEVFSLLQNMSLMGCKPSHETYITLIRKFCRWRQLDIVFKLWNDMIENGLDPDRTSYIALIHGLFLNGQLEEAHKYSQEMKDKHLLPERKLDEILQTWFLCKQNLVQEASDSETHEANRTIVASTKSDSKEHFLSRPEARKVVRERGFSFWES